MDTVIVIMQKDNLTGLFEKELASLNITKNDKYILNIYAIKNDDDTLNLHLKLTTEHDVEDWEYNAIYDYYDIEIFNEVSLEVIENEKEYNPTWEVILKYIDDKHILEKTICEILELHKKELGEVFSIINDKKGEYENAKI